MKKNSRLIALMLALFALLGAAACAANGPSGDTSTYDSAPQTTAKVIEVTTPEPVISVVAPPQTSPPDTSEFNTEELTDPAPPVTTAPPKPEDVLKILKPSGSGEAVTSIFDSENAEILNSREARFLALSLCEIKVTESKTLTDDVKNAVSAGISKQDLLLISPTDGVSLLSAGFLEDLSEAGIGINSESVGIRSSITETLTVGGGTYLLACEGLVSDLSASYALKYDGTPLSGDPAEDALSGNFTVERMLQYMAQIEGDALSLDSYSPLALYTGVGGHIFGKDDAGMPASALATHPKFADKFRAASELTSGASDTDTAVFTLSLLDKAEKDEIYLPLPKQNAEGEYATLIEKSELSLFAAPVGVVDGSRLSFIIKSFSMASAEYRDNIRKELTVNSGEKGAELIGIMEASAVLDLGMILGWGDIDDLIEDELYKGSKPEDFLSDRVVKMRNSAVEAAAKIVADRLKAQ